MGAENLRPWQKGQSGNPGGRPRLPEELRAIKSLTHTEVCKLVSKYGRMKPDDLEACIAARQIPMVEMAIARIFEESAKKGDFMRLAFLMDRAVGKAPVAEIGDEDAEAMKEISELSDQELLRLVKEKLPSLEKAGA